MSQAPEPRRQRLDPDTRREQIYACAKRMFSELPYADVSTGGIAAEAGVARGLVNHYFGTKRELYLQVVRESSTMSELAMAAVPEGTAEERVEACVAWFLDSLERSGGSWLAATGSTGLGKDPELERILITAENESVERLVQALGLAGYTGQRQTILAMIRAYAQMARSGGREWLRRKTLTRRQLHALLAATLLAIVRSAIPALVAEAPAEEGR